jgi:hypothetical protein
VIIVSRSLILLFKVAIGCTLVILVLFIIVPLGVHFLMVRRRRSGPLCASESFACQGGSSYPSILPMASKSLDIINFKTPSNSRASICLLANHPVVVDIVSDATGCVGMTLVLTPPSPSTRRRSSRG